MTEQIPKLATEHQAELAESARINTMIAKATKASNRNGILAQIASANDERVSVSALAAATRDI